MIPITQNRSTFKTNKHEKNKSKCTNKISTAYFIDFYLCKTVVAFNWLTRLIIRNCTNNSPAF